MGGTALLERISGMGMERRGRVAQGSQCLSFLSQETNPSTSGQHLTRKGSYGGNTSSRVCQAHSKQWIFRGFILGFFFLFW